MKTQFRFSCKFELFLHLNKFLQSGGVDELIRGSETNYSKYLKVIEKKSDQLNLIKKYSKR